MFTWKVAPKDCLRKLRSTQWLQTLELHVLRTCFEVLIFNYYERRADRNFVNFVRSAQALFHDKHLINAATRGSITKQYRTTNRFCFAIQKHHENQTHLSHIETSCAISISQVNIRSSLSFTTVSIKQRTYASSWSIECKIQSRGFITLKWKFRPINACNLPAKTYPAITRIGEQKACKRRKEKEDSLIKVSRLTR